MLLLGDLFDLPGAVVCLESGVRSTKSSTLLKYLIQYLTYDVTCPKNGYNIANIQKWRHCYPCIQPSVQFKIRHLKIE